MVVNVLAKILDRGGHYYGNMREKSTDTDTARFSLPPKVKSNLKDGNDNSQKKSPFSSEKRNREITDKAKNYGSVGVILSITELRAFI